MIVAMTFGSVLTAAVLVVGHINVGLEPTDVAPDAQSWGAHILRTTASFGTRSLVTRWLTGGMTHHVAHHLRPIARRAELPAITATAVKTLAINNGLVPVEFATIGSAVLGHVVRLRELGYPQRTRVDVHERPAQAREPAVV